MRNLKWTQVLVFGLVVLVVFGLGLAFLLLLFGGGRGMMGPGGMRGGWCPWCGGTGRLGGGILGTILGLALACLLPLGLLALLVIAGVWLAGSLQADGSSSAPPSSESPPSSSDPSLTFDTCPACNRRVERGWVTCPYCGEDLQDEG